MIDKTNMMPIISELYCSSYQTMFVVRRRPYVVNGGGFVVMDCSAQRVLFRVHGRTVLGTKGDLILRTEDGDALLFMRRKGGMVEALSIYKEWKGYTFSYQGSQIVVFSLKEPNSCLVKNNTIRISTWNRGLDFKINGSFPDKCCSIVDSGGNKVAHLVGEDLNERKGLYYVVVKPGIDQAFVFGVIAMLDYIY
ncbi:Protein LURP-one-related 6, partial [Mucuna pruriens]